MTQIQDPPNNYDFGYEFNYAVWPKNTEVSLVNVPWDSSYRDIVAFNSSAQLDTYIQERATSGIRIENMSYVKPNQPVRVNVPFNVAMKYNYLQAINRAQPINPPDELKRYYYFITDIRYIAPNTTELILQLDVWTSFQFDVTFGRAFVERGHIGIANENQMYNFGRRYLTVPEGFDLGSDYQNVGQRLIGPPFAAASDAMSIMAVSTVDLSQDPGTINDPNLGTAPGGSIQGIPTGATVYLWETVTLFREFMNKYKEYPWITQGIVSVQMVPNIKRYAPDFTYSSDPEYYGMVFPGLEWIGQDRVNYSVQSGWREPDEFNDIHERISSHIGPRYSHLNKFWTFPYLAFELTAYNGNSIILKPEFTHENLRFSEIVSYLPGNVKLAIYPQNYNSNGPAIEDGGSSVGEGLNTSIGITRFPQVPIVNDMGISYIASQAHTLSAQRQGANWAQNRAIMSADVARENVTTAEYLNLERELIESGRAIDSGALTADNIRANVLPGSIGSIGGGIAGGATRGVAGAIGGGVAGLANSGLNYWTANNNADLAFSQAMVTSDAIKNSASAQRSAMTETGDRNQDLARSVAEGDYSQSILALDSKIQDAELIQPSMSGQYGGDTLGLIHGWLRVELKIKMPEPGVIRRIGEYWLRYGYSINEMMHISTLKVMSHFTYWRMKELYVRNSAASAGVPDKYRNTIRGIFEKGVTVWNNPGDIGILNPGENTPLNGISY